MYSYLYFNCIFVVHPDDDHESGRNMLVKNISMWLDVFIDVLLLVRLRNKLNPLKIDTNIIYNSYLTEITMGAGPFSGVKRPGHGADHPPHLSVKVMKG